MPPATSTNVLSEGLSMLEDSFSLPADVVIIATIFIMLLATALWIGKHRFVPLLAGLYLAIILYGNFPFKTKVLLWTNSDAGIFYSQLLIFGAIVFLGYFLANRLASVESLGGLPKVLESVLLAGTTTGLLVAIGYYILPLDLVYNFAPNIDRYFTMPESFFWWLAAPVVALLLTSRR
jgi:hypothetical protein